MDHDPDAWRFREYAEGHSNDSPVDLSGREGYEPPCCILCREQTATTGLNGQYCEDCWPSRNEASVKAILEQGKR